MTVENVLPSAIKMNFIMLVELSKLLVNIRKRWGSKNRPLRDSSIGANKLSFFLYAYILFSVFYVRLK